VSAETPALIVWVDAQLPASLASWLRQTHHVDARHVKDLNQLTADDSAIFAAARSGGASVVMTKDEDFVQLVERRGPPPQVVWVTCGNVRNVELREILSSSWPRVAELLASGEPLVELGRRR
jgi:predicted nuclease of predicted toxin-antitoxin system